jgi:hypothetical protein
MPWLLQDEALQDAEEDSIVIVICTCCPHIMPQSSSLCGWVIVWWVGDHAAFKVLSNSPKDGGSPGSCRRQQSRSLLFPKTAIITARTFHCWQMLVDVGRYSARLVRTRHICWVYVHVLPLHSRAKQCAHINCFCSVFVAFPWQQQQQQQR